MVGDRPAEKGFTALRSGERLVLQAVADTGLTGLLEPLLNSLNILWCFLCCLSKSIESQRCGEKSCGGMNGQLPHPIMTHAGHPARALSRPQGSRDETTGRVDGGKGCRHTNAKIHRSIQIGRTLCGYLPFR